MHNDEDDEDDEDEKILGQKIILEMIMASKFSSNGLALWPHQCTMKAS